MHADRWERVSQLFDEAITLPPVDRLAFIRSACNDDVELERQLLSLVQAHDRTSGLLEQAPQFLVDENDPATAVDKAGDPIGPYRLVRQIGAGGMASVWLADRTDGVLNRTVALKRPHTSWIGPHAERVAQERDILARLEHPNIARLYDAGTAADGRPYLALEHVDGVPLNQYCDNVGASLHDRLGLLLQVLRAVTYAHAHLVIHQDLKPSNILVSASGHVSLLDFGVARLLRLESDTPVGARPVAALTPDYASPEQIRNDAISATSDIYSFGIVAYEVLTGQRPYRLTVTNRNDLMRAHEQLRILAPSDSVTDTRLRRALRGDLDAIICKALARDPLQRYASADALAADIDRYLRNEPISARPDRLAYRLGKFVARNRLQTAFAALGFAALAIGTVVALAQARQARSEAARADAVKGFALSILEEADTDSGAGSDTTVADLLAAARKRIATELPDRPAIAAELLGAIGYGLVGHSRVADGADALAEAMQLSQQADGPDALSTIRIKVMYGEALAKLGKTEDALALLRTCVPRARELGDWPTESDAWRWQSYALIDAGKVDDAIAAARSAVVALPVSLPEDRRALLRAAEAHLGLANVLNNARREGAVEAARRSLELLARIPGGLQSSNGLQARLLLGQALVRTGKQREGLTEMTTAYDGIVALLGPDHTMTSTFANLLGNTLLELGDTHAAVKMFQASLDGVEHDTANVGPFDIGIANFSIGNALVADGDVARGLAHLDKAVPLLAEALGPTGQLTLRTRSVAALALAKLGRLQEADEAFNALRDAPLAGPDAAAHTGRLAEFRHLQGRSEDALRLARQAHAGLQTAPSKALQARSLARLGRYLLDAGEIQEGTAALTTAIESLRREQLFRSPDLVEAESALARVQRGPTQHPGPGS